MAKAESKKYLLSKCLVTFFREEVPGLSESYLNYFFSDVSGKATILEKTTGGRLCSRTKKCNCVGSYGRSLSVYNHIPDNHHCCMKGFSITKELESDKEGCTLTLIGRNKGIETLLAKVLRPIIVESKKRSHTKKA